MPFDLQKCARPNILALQPYRCARDDYKDDGTNVLLDANENAYGPGLALNKIGRFANGTAINGVHKGHKEGQDDGPSSGLDFDLSSLNRYPDPHQSDLKQLLIALRQTHAHASPALPLSPANLFVGVGSDEAIDALLRCFCRPGTDRILTCPPTYGMYAVSAQVNDVGVVHVHLLPEQDFALDVKAISGRLSQDDADTIKLVYICSPGNPTATLVEKSQIQQILQHPTWNGIVVLDEAYVDFAQDPNASLAEWVTAWPNLVVMQTLSKAFGLAGIRLGAAFASVPVAALLNNLKAPYNISAVTSLLACRALEAGNLAVMRENRARIVLQRERLVEELPKVKGIGRFRGGYDSNFLLVEVLDAQGKPCNVTALKVYEGLAERKGVVVRFRGKEHGCEGCLRITVGTESEVERFLKELRVVLGEVYGSGEKVGKVEEEKKEIEANGVLA